MTKPTPAQLAELAARLRGLEQQILTQKAMMNFQQHFQAKHERNTLLIDNIPTILLALEAIEGADGMRDFYRAETLQETRERDHARAQLAVATSRIQSLERELAALSARVETAKWVIDACDVLAKIICTGVNPEQDVTACKVACEGCLLDASKTISALAAAGLVVVPKSQVKESDDVHEG